MGHSRGAEGPVPKRPRGICPVRPHPHPPYSRPGALASPQSHDAVPRAFQLTWTEGVESPTMMITAMRISNIRPLLSKPPRSPSSSDPSQFQGTLRGKQCRAEVLIPKIHIPWSPQEGIRPDPQLLLGHRAA